MCLSKLEIVLTALFTSLSTSSPQVVSERAQHQLGKYLSIFAVIFSVAQCYCLAAWVHRTDITSAIAVKEATLSLDMYWTYLENTKSSVLFPLVGSVMHCVSPISQHPSTNQAALMVSLRSIGIRWLVIVQPISGRWKSYAAMHSGLKYSPKCGQYSKCDLFQNTNFNSLCLSQVSKASHNITLYV